MKVGDKVRVNGGGYGSPELRPGVTGVVVHVLDASMGLVVVKMDSGFKPTMIPNEWDGWGFYTAALELIDGDKQG